MPLMPSITTLTRFNLGNSRGNNLFLSITFAPVFEQGLSLDISPLVREKKKNISVEKMPINEDVIERLHRFSVKAQGRLLFTPQFKYLAGN